MKRFLLLAIIPLLFSCTSYYNVRLNKDTVLYESRNDTTNSIIIIPANEQVYLSKKSKKHRKIKYGNYTGWVTSPTYTVATSEQGESKYNPVYSTGISKSSSGGSVQVKGYTKKDGTYVKPHTRSSPKRH
jgi:hypothetical protein